MLRRKCRMPVCLTNGDTYTFWGKGLSQGHSDAIRRVEGVKNGVQYTIPSNSAIEKVRSGARPTLTTKEKHSRECFVVLKDGAGFEVERLPGPPGKREILRAGK